MTIYKDSINSKLYTSILVCIKNTYIIHKKLQIGQNMAIKKLKYLLKS